MRPPANLDRVIAFLQRLETERFYGKVVINYQAGRPTHVETTCRQSWETAKLPLDGDITGSREPVRSRGIS